MASSEGRVIRIRALVVDDDPLARRNVTVLLRGDPDIDSIEECGSGAEAIEAIRLWQPDLVFLDVQMPECGGFEVIELLGADLPRAIVFAASNSRVEESSSPWRRGWSEAWFRLT